MKMLPVVRVMIVIRMNDGPGFTTNFCACSVKAIPMLCNTERIRVR